MVVRWQWWDHEKQWRWDTIWAGTDFGLEGGCSAAGKMASDRRRWWWWKVVAARARDNNSTSWTLGTNGKTTAPAGIEGGSVRDLGPRQLGSRMESRNANRASEPSLTHAQTRLKLTLCLFELNSNSIEFWTPKLELDLKVDPVVRTRTALYNKKCTSSNSAPTWRSSKLTGR